MKHIRPLGVIPEGLVVILIFCGILGNETSMFQHSICWYDSSVCDSDWVNYYEYQQRSSATCACCSILFYYRYPHSKRTGFENTAPLSTGWSACHCGNPWYAGHGQYRWDCARITRFSRATCQVMLCNVIQNTLLIEEF